MRENLKQGDKVNYSFLIVYPHVIEKNELYES